jgi:hypothetical protein
LPSLRVAGVPHRCHPRGRRHGDVHPLHLRLLRM